MNTYRFSVDGTICFDIEANNAEEAMAMAIKYVNIDQPECYELGDEHNTCAYPGNADENLTLESGITELLNTPNET